MIVTTDAEPPSKKISDKPAKRVTPSGGNVQDSLLDFIVDIDSDVLNSTDIDDLVTLFSDIEWLSKKSVNEALHYAKASHTPEKIRAHKWYIRNKGRVAKLQARLKKSKGLQAKKKIMAKSGRTLKKKRKKKYHTKSHVNESKLRARVKASVEELFAPIKYRVIESFTVAGVEAALYEEIHFKFGVWTLRKRDGEKILFKCEKENIANFIKLESEGITLEDINAI